MKRLFVLVLLAFILSACAGSPAPLSPNCGGGTCVTMRLAETILLNVPIPVTITVQPEEDIRSLEIYLATLGSPVLIEGDHRWTVDARANQPLTVRSVIRFTQEGLFYIYGQAYNPRRGGVATYDVRVVLTRAGGTVYYSGTPLPITPVIIDTPPPYILNPQGTPIPRPTEAKVLLTPTRIPTPVPTPTRALYP